MAKKRATSSDVAKLAGVSQPTVSMILNNYEKISFSPETVRRVMDACEQLNYRIPAAKKGGNGETKLIMAMCPSYTNLYYISLLEAMCSQVEERGYSLTVFSSRRDMAQEAQFAQLAARQEALGALLLYKPANLAALQQLTSQMPVVAICDKTEISNMDIIELDSEKLGMIIADHLLELGHRKIVYISTELNERYPARLHRLKGIQAGFAKAGVSPFNIMSCTMESENVPYTQEITSYETGYCLGKRVVEKYEEITALVGMNDMVAIGIMDALVDKKLRIPQDYSVCGCDNTMISQYRCVSMTSVEHFDANRGREAVDVLIRKIEQGGVEWPASAVRVEFVPKLVPRNSTGPRRKKKKENLWSTEK